ncbi:hypothetical protein D5H75_31895 [Bailinhaonella thermotolerans]|uniref:Uncharacterized protein n=1 Tax=Bailinhaonella thermotolerans TaxID=1070861 RepID=A0A3A4ABW0_9ACTN|nr:hypothetical protein D5H75_31895 [Bailinhaonella thermotolerans]
MAGLILLPTVVPASACAARALVKARRARAGLVMVPGATGPAMVRLATGLASAALGLSAAVAAVAVAAVVVAGGIIRLP